MSKAFMSKQLGHKIGEHRFTNEAFEEYFTRFLQDAIREHAVVDVLSSLSEIVIKSKKNGCVSYDEIDAIIPKKWKTRSYLIETLKLILDEVSVNLSKHNNHISDKGRDITIFRNSNTKKLNANELNANNVNMPTTKKDSTNKKIEIYGDESPLHKLGYRVGITEGQTSNVRRNHLDDCYEIEFVGKFKDKDQWGNPNTEIRLKKMVNHISSMISLKTRDDQKKYQHAINDWVEDLDYLYKKYYLVKKYRFRWPNLKQ